MIPLFKTDQIREADNFAIEKLKIPSIVLMENAAINIVDAIFRNFPELYDQAQFGIVCGKGNNGGDGFAVARHLSNEGFPVVVLSIAKEDELSGDALTNYRIIKNLSKENNFLEFKNYKDKKSLSALNDCDVFIDAILGTGAKGELKEPYNSIVNYLNDLPGYKIAIDAPTGINLEMSTGESIFNTDLTVTLAGFKAGLFYGKGYSKAGKIVKGSIGMDEEYFETLPVDTYLIEPEDAFLGLPIKKLDSYKYSAGKVLVIAGSGALPGAAFFTTNSSMEVGAGSAILAFPKSIKELAHQNLDSAILLPYESEEEILTEKNIKELEERINWADVIAIGPGLGRDERTQKAVQQIIKNNKDKKFVIDADAIFALRNNFQKLNLSNSIFTPHHKEFADLIGIEQIELENNLLAVGKEFARKNNTYLVLKNAPTIIFNPRGEIFINSSGNQGMAKFGMGDVLTGVLSGFIAQSKNVEEAVISAVYLHSLSADLLAKDVTMFGITATKLMENMPNAIKFIHETFIPEA